MSGKHEQARVKSRATGGGNATVIATETETALRNVRENAIGPVNVTDATTVTARGIGSGSMTGRAGMAHMVEGDLEMEVEVVAVAVAVEGKGLEAMDSKIMVTGHSKNGWDSDEKEYRGFLYGNLVICRILLIWL